MNNSRLFKFILNGYALGESSIHGPSHWKRVERNGLEIAENNGADKAVVSLFAMLHDSQRENEGYDPEHGPRASDFCQWLRKKSDFLQLTDEQFDKLTYACKHHTGGMTSDDATIGACWDADRLDLPRVGITPLPKYMSTEQGKRMAEAMQQKKKFHQLPFQEDPKQPWWKFW